MPDPAIQNRTDKQFLSDRITFFTESAIRDMTRQALLHNAVNLSQGFPDFPAPQEIKRAAQQAIEKNLNQYTITWGARNLRQAIAAHLKEGHGLKVEPDSKVTVCCGSTEGMISTLMALCNA